MKALQSSFQPITNETGTCSLDHAGIADVLLPKTEGNNETVVTLLPGADGYLLFLFSFHFNHTEKRPVAQGQSRGRVEQGKGKERDFLPPFLCEEAQRNGYMPNQREK